MKKGMIKGMFFGGITLFFIFYMITLLGHIKEARHLQLLCKLTSSDDNYSVTDWYSIKGYTSIAQALENPVLKTK